MIENSNSSLNISKLAERVEKLKRCFRLCEVINSSLDLEEVLERIMRTSRQALRAETCSLLLSEGEGPDQGLIFTVAQGPVASQLPKGARLPRGAGIAGWVHVNGQGLLIPDCYADNRFNPEVDRKTGYKTRTMMCVPLALKDRILGVAQLINKAGEQPFDEEDLETFSLIAAQAAIALENARLHQESLTKQRLEFDLEVAGSVQRGFLPHAPPKQPGFDLAGASLPCDTTGGDYYDYLDLPELQGHGFAVVVGDVTGHGIPAALLMASARAMLRARVLQAGTLGQMITDVNSLLCQDTGQSGRFMTLFCLLADTDLGLLRYLKAGHDPAIVYNPQTDEFSELTSKGIPLGVMADWSYQQAERLGWRAGELLVIGTDGIWECRGQDDQMYGKDRLMAVLRANAHLSAQEILQAAFADLDAFRQGRPVDDDQTLVVVKTREDRLPRNIE